MTVRSVHSRVPGGPAIDAAEERGDLGLGLRIVDVRPPLKRLGDGPLAEHRLGEVAISNAVTYSGQIDVKRFWNVCLRWNINSEFISAVD